MSQVSVQSQYAGFSFASGNLDENYFHALGVEYARSLIELFLNRFAEVIPQCSTGVDRLLGTLASGSLGFNAYWCHALGKCFRCIKSGDELLARHVAAELALQAGPYVTTSEWEIRLKAPDVFLWDSWLLPICDYVAVNGNGTTAKVIAKCHEKEYRVGFQRTEGDLWLGENASQLQTIGTGSNRIVLLHRRAISQFILDDLPVSPLLEIGAEDYQRLTETFEFLREFTPKYFAWITRIVRRLIVIDSPKDVLKSGSLDGKCGLVYISNNDDILSLVDMLVHEASHQYFYLITREGDPTHCSSTELFYSPFVMTTRTLDRVIFGYHAFGNVYLFYRSLLTVFPEKRDTLLERMAVVLRDLQVVEGYLTSREKLTPLGVALIEPLMEEIHSAV